MSKLRKTDTALPEASDWGKVERYTSPKVRLRNWLTFLRIHTSNLTQVGAMLGPLLAGVRNVPLLVIYLLWGLCYHAWGFTDNNIQDYAYDKQDPAKQHFALVKGAIPIGKARLVNQVFFVPVLLVGLWFGYSNPASLAFLGLSITAGMLYNRTCKKSLLAPVYITVAFTSIPLFTYFSQTTAWNLPIIIVAIYTVFLMLFQIAFEGYLKDLQSDPVNLLRTWGATVKDGKLDLGLQGVLWVLVKFGNILVGFCYFAAINNVESTAFLLYGFLGVAIAIAYTMLAHEDYNNKRVTSNAARMEILTYFALIAALEPVFGWTITATLFVYPILWFACLNYLSWKTILRPKV